MTMNESNWLTRIGSGSAITGALCAGAGNLLHPVTPRNDPHGVAEVIAGSHHWTVIHLLINLGVVLMLAGLLALRHSMPLDGLSSALTRLGMYAATVGATIGLITVGLDGVAAKRLADEWAAAPESGKSIALATASANETVNFGLAGLFNVTFAGFPFVLFGLAMTRAETYPKWLGWIAFAAGLGSIGAGGFQALSGKPTTTSLILTIIGPTTITLWLLVVGVLMWLQQSNKNLA